MRRHLLGLLFITACTTTEDLSQVEAPSVIENGQNLNGQNLNGQNLNGQNLNGQNLNGPDNGTFTIWTSLQGVKLNGKTLNATLDRTVFSGFDGTGTKSGLDFLQAEFQAMRGDGRGVRMRVRDIVPAASGSTWRYMMEYREDDGIWYPVCEDANGPRAAIPVNGIWDHRQGVAGGGAHIASTDKFTFACEGTGAIAKCIGMGYVPWESFGTVNLAKHHQSCIRLMRGDYCGTGASYTQNGNRVNVFDQFGIQQDTENWVFEAEWDQHGARCFNPLNRSRAGIPCYDARAELGCGGSSYKLGTLLVNETPSGGLTP